MWHLTCDTWHVTSGHMTQSAWGLLCQNCRSLALTVWERLKSDMTHVTHDTWQVVSKSIIYPPGKYKTICIVSMFFFIISKSTSFLLKLDLHCNFPNFRNVLNTSVHCCIERERRPVARNCQVCQVVHNFLTDRVYPGLFYKQPRH